MDVQRNVIALCRCGGTRRPPFCDSTHKKRKSRRAEQSARGKDEGGEP
ncbi:CDGSH iron-sulfur domain-containing protein [Rhodococcus parequi]